MRTRFRAYFNENIFNEMLEFENSCSSKFLVLVLRRFCSCSLSASAIFTRKQTQNNVMLFAIAMNHVREKMNSAKKNVLDTSDADTSNVLEQTLECWSSRGEGIILWTMSSGRCPLFLQVYEMFVLGSSNSWRQTLTDEIRKTLEENIFKWEDESFLRESE